MWLHLKNQDVHLSYFWNGAELHVVCSQVTGLLIQWRIQDFPGGSQVPKVGVLTYYFAENCMKMKEFEPGGGGARPWRHSDLCISCNPKLKLNRETLTEGLRVHLTSDIYRSMLNHSLHLKRSQWALNREVCWTLLNI